MQIWGRKIDEWTRNNGKWTQQAMTSDSWANKWSGQMALGHTKPNIQWILGAWTVIAEPVYGSALGHTQIYIHWVIGAHQASHPVGTWGMNNDSWASLRSGQMALGHTKPNIQWVLGAWTMIAEPVYGLDKWLWGTPSLTSSGYLGHEQW